MRELFRKLKERICSGQDTVLVSIVASSGSVPRGAGAHMLAAEEGRICGTIGGGAVEHAGEEMAREVLKKRSSRLESYALRPDQVRDLGMVCGGDVQVFFLYIPAGDRMAEQAAKRAEELFRTGEPSWLVADITKGSEGGLAVCEKNGKTAGMPVPDEIRQRLGNKAFQAEAKGRRYYCEKLTQGDTVYIFGGGHVAQALVPALSAVSFRCIVLEERGEFCDPALFPGAAGTRLVDFGDPAVYAQIRKGDLVCVMTRGHKDDLTVQKMALGTEASYIGVIGSRRKKAAVFARLMEEGFTEKDLERITTPIGLPIRAETPEEIAVSITAQLIAHRASRMEGSGAEMSGRETKGDVRDGKRTED